jgi:hypothetical protein
MRAIRSDLGREPVEERREAKVSVSRTVREPIRASSCSTKRDRERKRDLEGLLPFTRTVEVLEMVEDEVGREARMFRRVVLPEPEGPIRARTSPGKG